MPSLRAGNVVDRPAVVAALRQVLGALNTGKLRDVTVIVPDLAVRVLLLDFDSLPSSVEDALAGGAISFGEAAAVLCGCGAGELPGDDRARAAVAGAGGGDPV